MVNVPLSTFSLCSIHSPSVEPFPDTHLTNPVILSEREGANATERESKDPCTPRPRYRRSKAFSPCCWHIQQLLTRERERDNQPHRGTVPQARAPIFAR
jgi:hypothetical protein